MLTRHTTGIQRLLERRNSLRRLGAAQHLFAVTYDVRAASAKDFSGNDDTSAVS